MPDHATCLFGARILPRTLRFSHILDPQGESFRRLFSQPWIPLVFAWRNTILDEYKKPQGTTHLWIERVSWNIEERREEIEQWVVTWKADALSHLDTLIFRTRACICSKDKNKGETREKGKFKQLRVSCHRVGSLERGAGWCPPA